MLWSVALTDQKLENNISIHRVVILEDNSLLTGPLHLHVLKLRHLMENMQFSQRLRESCL